VESIARSLGTRHPPQIGHRIDEEPKCDPTVRERTERRGPIWGTIFRTPSSHTKPPAVPWKADADDAPLPGRARSACRQSKLTTADSACAGSKGPPHTAQWRSATTPTGTTRFRGDTHPRSLPTSTSSTALRPYKPKWWWRLAAGQVADLQIKAAPGIAASAAGRRQAQR
jgi:hypothetical protein